MKPDIYQVGWIGNGFLAVMAKPVAGEWIEDEFRGIAELGVKSVVSLLEPHEAYELGLQDERHFSEKHGMEFMSFPIQDRGMPQSVQEFGRFSKQLHDEIVAGKNTVVHCRAGIGRSGLVAAAVLLHCGYVAESAFRQVSLTRRVQVPDTFEQRTWLKENAYEITRCTAFSRATIPSPA